MKFLITCWFFVLFSFTATALNNQVTIDLEKSDNNRWVVNYDSNTEASQLAFYRQSDSSRTQRWLPLSDDFEVSFNFDEDTGIYHEYIHRKDHKTFQRVSLELTPTYKHIDKEYAPFSPFSDGGMLVYTGRFFACIDSCDGAENHWHLTLKVPQDQHIIVHGQIHKKQASWTGHAEGQNIYVGKQEPILSDRISIMIDQGLPSDIKTNLQVELPKLISYFSKSLGSLSEQDMVIYASYANVRGGSSQGGTLPNQIFMHWNMDNLHKKVHTKGFTLNLLWFFAHEVAHFYQRSSTENSFAEQHDSWIHEGHAEYLAGYALKQLYSNSEMFVNKKTELAKDACSNGLLQNSLKDAAKNGHFDLYYSCGLVIYNFLDQTAEFKQGVNRINAIDLWKSYRLNLEKTQNITQFDTFIKTIGQFYSADSVSKVIDLIQAEKGQALKLFQKNE